MAGLRRCLFQAALVTGSSCYGQHFFQPAHVFAALFKSAWRNLKRQAKNQAKSGKPTMPTGNTDSKPKLSPIQAQTATPSD